MKTDLCGGRCGLRTCRALHRGFPLCGWGLPCGPPPQPDVCRARPLTSYPGLGRLLPPPLPSVRTTGQGPSRKWNGLPRPQKVACPFLEMSLLPYDLVNLEVMSEVTQFCFHLWS